MALRRELRSLVCPPPAHLVASSWPLAHHSVYILFSKYSPTASQPGQHPLHHYTARHSTQSTRRALVCAASRLNEAQVSGTKLQHLDVTCTNTTSLQQSKVCIARTACAWLNPLRAPSPSSHGSTRLIHLACCYRREPTAYWQLCSTPTETFGSSSTYSGPQQPHQHQSRFAPLEEQGGESCHGSNCSYSGPTSHQRRSNGGHDHASHAALQSEPPEQTSCCIPS